MTAASDKCGRKYRMNYQNAWGNILGRDIRQICRFCIDGLGEAADISCGDAWYLTEEDKPDFSEREGRNVIFVNTLESAELLGDIADGGYLHLEDYKERIGELKDVQMYQYQRKGTMRIRLAAMRLFGQSAPLYQVKKLGYYSRHISTDRKLRMFIGTIRRIIQRKI